MLKVPQGLLIWQGQSLFSLMIKIMDDYDLQFPFL